MKSNVDYIREFVLKHHYNTQVHVQCHGGRHDYNIRMVIFDENDVPSKKEVSIDDIKYDIDSSLPEDVFYRWLEYCDENEDDVSYVYWMTKMDNKYFPMGVDTSELRHVKEQIYFKIDELKNMRWF